MKKTIIAIKGPEKSGKSECILKLLSSLKELFLHSEKKIEVLYPTDLTLEEEFLKVFAKQGNVKIDNAHFSLALKIDNQLKIGIESEGAPIGIRFALSLEKMRKEECDIIITSCRNSGNTFDVVSKLESYQKIFIDKEEMKNDHSSADIQTVNKVVKVLKTVIYS